MTDKSSKSFLLEPVSRRRLIGLGVVALAGPFLSQLPAFASAEPLPPDRSLSFYNTHTGESASVEYCHSGCLVTPSLGQINYVLRDHRSGETKEIKVKLLDLLHSLSRKVATEEPFHVISCYRSPQTNSSLRRLGGGVAENSLHLRGEAIDVRMPGVKLRDLYRAALSLRGGGVGIYPDSNFVHVDVGRVRTW